MIPSFKKGIQFHFVYTFQTETNVDGRIQAPYYLLSEIYVYAK